MFIWNMSTLACLCVVTMLIRWQVNTRAVQESIKARLDRRDPLSPAASFHDRSGLGNLESQLSDIQRSSTQSSAQESKVNTRAKAKQVGQNNQEQNDTKVPPCNPPKPRGYRRKLKRAFKACLNSEIPKHKKPSFPVAVSKTSGRRFIASVITMRRTFRAKLDLFRSEWRKAWPELDFVESVGFENNAELQGMGNLAAMYNAGLNALRNSRDFDYFLVFEDDGLPYLNTTWPADLDQALTHFESHDGAGLLLGGHHFAGYNIKEVHSSTETHGQTVIRVRRAYGAYGMAIPRRYLQHLVCQYEVTLLQKDSPLLASDMENWKLWKKLGDGGYVAAPLLVNHNPSSYSFTWSKTRLFSQERYFWRNDEVSA